MGRVSSNFVRTCHVLFVASFAVIACAQSGYQLNAPWPKYGGNNGNTGYFNHAGSTGLPKWDVSGPGECFNASVGANGTLYVGWLGSGVSGGVCALSTNNGAQKWNFACGEVVDAPAVGANGMIYFGSDDHNVYAVDGSTGIEKWSFPTDGPLDYSPTLGPDGTVYIGSFDRNVYALDGATGELEWSFKTEGTVGAPALDASGNLYAVGNYLYSLNSKTGAENWSFVNGTVPDQDGLIGNVALAPNGNIYCGSLTSVYAVDPSNGSMIWRFNPNLQFIGGFAIGPDNTVYALPDGNGVFALDGSTGTEKWFASLPVNYIANLALDSSGVLYVPEFSTDTTVNLDALNSATGTLLWSTPTPGGRIFGPAFDANGNIYITSGSVFALSSVTISRLYTAAASVEAGETTQGVVQLSAPGALGYSGITLSSNNSCVQLPATASVPVNSSGVSFRITTSGVRSTQNVTLIARIGATSAQTTLQVTPAPIYAFYTAEPWLAEGLSMNGVVQIPNPAPAGGTTISLYAGSSYLKIPQSVTVPAGSTGVSFPIQSLTGANPSNLTLVATLGSCSRDAYLYLVPNYVSNLYCSPSTVQGGSPATIVVQLSAKAPAGGQVVTLATPGYSGFVPSTVTVSAGSTGVSFQIPTTILRDIGIDCLPITASLYGTTKSTTLYLTGVP